MHLFLSICVLFVLQLHLQNSYNNCYSSASPNKWINKGEEIEVGRKIPVKSLTRWGDKEGDHLYFVCFVASYYFAFVNTQSSAGSILASGLTHLQDKRINYIRSTEANKSIYELLINTELRIREGGNMKWLLWGECRQEVGNVRGHRQERQHCHD